MLDMLIFVDRLGRGESPSASGSIHFHRGLNPSLDTSAHRERCLRTSTGTGLRRCSSHFHRLTLGCWLGCLVCLAVSPASVPRGLRRSATLKGRHFLFGPAPSTAPRGADKM